MPRLEVLGVRVEMPTNQPVVLLREVGGRRGIPIWVGAAEASAIAYVQQELVPPRPLTHDLLVGVITELGHQVTEVQIASLTDGAFHANLVLTGSDGTVTTIDSRSSDAIAVALRANSPITVSDELLDEVGFDLGEDGAGETGEDVVTEDVVAEFKEFLDQVSADDFQLPPADDR